MNDSHSHCRALDGHTCEMTGKMSLWNWGFPRFLAFLPSNWSYLAQATRSLNSSCTALLRVREQQPLAEEKRAEAEVAHEEAAGDRAEAVKAGSVARPLVLVWFSESDDGRDSLIPCFCGHRSLLPWPYLACRRFPLGCFSICPAPLSLS